MKKILTVVGARPQFIKAAMVSRAFSQKRGVKEVLVHTGQHYDANMSQIFLDELEIPAVDYHLGIGSHSHAKQTGDMMTAIEKVLMKEKPDCLLIYGDTNSTLAGALAAAKLHIPIAHVEAGLRSYNRRMPEEINRLVADQLSEQLFAPTKQAVSNLKSEGYADSRIKEVGDVMYDVALYYIEKAAQQSQILSRLECKKQEFILSTIHRAENTDDLARLSHIFSALARLGEVYPVILPLHPRTLKSIAQHYPEFLANKNITLIEPLGFLDMILLEKNAKLIITDSGGIQKEAFFYQVPCVTLRDETEWVETVELNWNRVVKPRDADYIYEQVMQALDVEGERGHYPYGRGNAAGLIVEHLC